MLLDPRQGLVRIDPGPWQSAICQPRQPLGDGALRPVKTGQKYTRCFAHPVGNHGALLQLELKRSPDQLLRDLKELLGQRDQFFCWQAAVALVHGLGQRIGNAGANPDRRGLLDAKLHRNGVGGLEPDAADIASQPIRVLGHDLDGVGTVGLEDPHRPRRADPVAVQEHHDFPHGLLLGPCGKNAGSANRSNAVDLAQPVRCCLDDVEDLLAEGAHQLLGVNRADAPDHAGREVLFDTVGRIWEGGAQEPRFELLAMGAVVDPFTRGGDPLAGRNGCGMADYGHDVTMPAGLGTQNAEAILGVVVGNTLDQAGQNFLI